MNNEREAINEQIRMDLLLFGVTIWTEQGKRLAPQDVKASEAPLTAANGRVPRKSPG